MSERFLPTEEQWLGLCLSTESDQPHEWRPLAWVVRNRVEDTRREFRRRGSVVQVVTQPRAFSAFNDAVSRHSDDHLAIFEEVAESVPTSRRNLATEAASEVLGAGAWHRPFSPDTFLFWSPVSMVPAGRLPSWDWSQLRVFDLAGIDPWRFLFAEYVHHHHPLSQQRQPHPVTAQEGDPAVS